MGSIVVLKPNGANARLDMQLGTLRKEWATHEEVTPSPETLVFWSEEDRNNYGKELKNRLNPWLYFGRKENGNGEQT